MEKTTKQADTVNEQGLNQSQETQQTTQKTEKAQASAEQQGMDAQKTEAKGQSAQRGAVGQEFEADRAKGENAGNKGKPASSKDMPAAPETGKSVEKDSEKDKEAVDQYAQSKGKKKSDTNDADKPSAKDDKEKAGDKSNEDKKEVKDDKSASKDGEKKDGEKKDGEKKEEKPGKAEQKASQGEDKAAKEGGSGDAQTEKGDKTAKEKPEKGEKAAKGGASGGVSVGGSGGGGGGGGGGGAGGGAIAVPSIGGDGPTVSPKGKGAGDNAVEAFANSGLSYQFENEAGLGGEVDADLEKDKAEIDSSLPGEEGAEINDGTADAAMEQGIAATKKANEGQKETNLDTAVTVDTNAADQNASLNAEASKSALNSASTEEIPEVPTVDVDYSGVDAAATEEAAKYASAQSEGSAKVASMDKTVTPRGFDDLKTPKAELEAEADAMESGDSPVAAEVAELSEEGKGILDISEFAEQSGASMESAKSQVAEAEQTRKAETEAQIAEHEEAIAQEIEKANEQEQQAIDAQTAEMEAQIDAEAANYEAELSAFDAEQQAEISAARTRLDTEKANAQAQIDAEHSKAKQEKENKEREAEEKKKEKRSLLQRIGDAICSAFEAIVNWLKDAVTAIVNVLKEAVCAILDAFVAVVSLINKELGEKLKQAVEKFKDFLDKLAQALIELVNKILDAIVEAVKAIVEAVVAAIEALVEAFKAALKAIWEALKAAFKAALELIKSVLSALADLFLVIFKKACELAGVDPAPMIAAAKNIIKDPGAFFSTLWSGIKQGFGQFKDNIGQNALSMVKNLMTLWLGPAGIIIPDNLPSVGGFITMGMSIIGIDVSSIVGAIEKRLKNETPKEEAEEQAEEEKEPSELEKILEAIKTGGISVVVEHIKPHLSGIGGEIIKATIQSLLPTLIAKGVAKLATMCNPVGGIVAAIKGVWDLIQFFRANFEALSGLGSALLGVLVNAANGDGSAAANAVEAALCQAIPLAIDLILRLIGLNIGEKVKGIVGKISEKIRGVVDKFINKLNNTKLMKKINGNKLVQKVTDGQGVLPTSKEREQYNKKKEEEKKQQAEDTKRVRERDATQNGSKTAAMGNWGTGLSDKVSDMKKAQGNKVFNATGLTSALKGEKEGNLGVNLDNSKYVKAISEHNAAKIDKHFEDKKTEKLTKRLAEAGGDVTKLSKADQQAIQKNPKIQEQLLRDKVAEKGEGALSKSEQKAWRKLKVADQTKSEPEKEKTVRDVIKEVHDESKKEREQKKKDKAYLKDGHSKKDLETKKRVEANVEESKKARESSRFGEYLDAEARANGVTAIDRMSDDEAARYAAYWGQSEKEDAWKRYQAKKAAEGKPVMDYDQWAANYDNLAKARAAKREKVEANIAESKAARDNSNFSEYASLEREVMEMTDAQASAPMTRSALMSPALEETSASSVTEESSAPKAAEPEKTSTESEPTVEVSDKELEEAEKRAKEVEKADERVTYGTWEEIRGSLQNTSNFYKDKKTNALRHIFSGEYTRAKNDEGKYEKVGAGFHYEGASDSKGSVKEGTRTEPNEYGVYEASVQVGGIDKGGNGGRSSFFPTSMSPQEVVDAINEAYDHRHKVKNKGKNTDIYYGYTSSGLCIQMILKDGKIKTAFPKYDNANGHLY